MNQLHKHNYELRRVFNLSFNSGALDRIDEMVSLNSIDTVLRECLSIEEMRDAGSFFTGQELATAVVEKFQTPITFDSVVLDPTCGAGNLLIETSRQLGMEASLTLTLEKWGKVLWGFDLHESFIVATKLRIVLEAIRRGASQDCSLDKALEFLPNIRVKDAMLVDENHVETVTHTIMNPPFISWKSPQDNYWKLGKVNAAGIIFDHYLRLLREGSEINAILPEVLRSGSRYEGFRNFVSSKMSASCNIWGRFNAKTDVDVFVLCGIVQQNESSILWHAKVENYIQLSDLYDVRVGPLVAYRDPEEGELYPYIHPRNAPRWQTLKNIDEVRRFDGAVIESPFIVVKRTSSPSDRYRASATIIGGKQSVAVENHMIVIKPKSCTLQDCKKLLKILKSQQTNDFLNERIRLRHLTVGVVKDIPISQGH